MNGRTPILLTATMLLVSLAGCFGAVDEDAPESAFGACPHWTQRQAPEEAQLAFNAGGSNHSHAWYPKDAFGEPQWQNGRYTFDMVLLEIASQTGDGDVRLAASANGTRLKIYDYAQEDGPKALVEAHLPAGQDAKGRLFEIYLSPVDQQATPRPAPLELSWSSDDAASLAFKVSYWDRVCGA